MSKSLRTFLPYAQTLTLVDEELEIDSDQVPKHVEGHGKVVVSVQRGNSTTKAKGVGQPLWDKYVAPETLVSSKAVVKDSHVSHAIK